MTARALELAESKLAVVGKCLGHAAAADSSYLSSQELWGCVEILNEVRGLMKSTTKEEVQ